MFAFSNSNVPSSIPPPFSIAFANFPSLPHIRVLDELVFRSVPVYILVPEAQKGAKAIITMLDERSKNNFKSEADENGLFNFNLNSSSFLFRLGYSMPIYDLSIPSLGLNSTFWIPLNGGDISSFDLPENDDWQSRFLLEVEPFVF